MRRARSPRSQGAVRLLAGALLVLWASRASGDDIARGDAAWAARAQGAQAERPREEPIRAARRAYLRALESDADHLEARWKLLRALHFAGDFAARTSAARAAHFEAARAVAEEGLDRLARRAGVRLEELDLGALPAALQRLDLAPQPVARLYFWSAINWGGFSRSVGLLRAVREGAANRIYRYARVALALEPDYEEGGVYRLLGSLHAELPRVPFITGWVDRERALPLLERAYALAPTNPANRLLLAVALLERDPARSSEAKQLLAQVAGLTPRTSMQIEDLVVQTRARARIAELAR